ncbi:phage tail protein [Cronobacter sakazakii]|uniref:phage tail protein n=1 Tax=Cronobacter sakazakii TaxID=28141 RepID=UPI000A1EE4BA|nr:phage tail protein [Cronobacter sakazakii]PUY28572.1 phage tail protein [Cronobacter sakazakii]
MNSSDIPSRITKAFGVNGLKNAIPVDSSTATDNSGVATFDKGFPPITMQPLSAGGIPPSGKDMNGVLYSATLQQQWQNAGMTYPFSQDFSDAISGYPKGAIVPSSVYTGQWLNLSESNGTSPESPTGANTGWVPINNYGVTQITMTSGSVVMSSLQAAKDRIIITGTLTSNVNLIFPAWIKSWVVHNNCTGNFSITCRTASGSGVIVIPGLVSRLFCDGVNISDETYNPNNDMVGMVAGFAMNSAPEGWLIANGSAVSRVTYARLFSRIGTLYGSGDGSTTFNLPDARGVVLRGADLGSGRDTGRVFGSYQPDAVKTIDLKYYGPGKGTGTRTVFALKQNSSAIFTDGITQSDGNPQAAFQMTGAVENRVKNLAILNCIKY